LEKRLLEQSQSFGLSDSLEQMLSVSPTADDQLSNSENEWNAIICRNNFNQDQELAQYDFAFFVLFCFIASVMDVCYYSNFEPTVLK